MKTKYLVWSCAMALAFLPMSGPRTAMADDLIVEPNPASGSGHYGSIQAAIDHAETILSIPTNTLTFQVVIEPGTYTGAITPISNVPIRGIETASTFLSGSGSDTLISVSNVTGLSIKNITIINAAIGISVSNSTIDIINNVFHAGTTGIAIQVQNSPQARIINNTFYQNKTAVSTSSDIPITNNIFSTNTTAISSQAGLAQITYNDYDNNSINGLTQAQLDSSHSIPSANTTQTTNPLFVDTTTSDFHLKEGSPCIDSGTNGQDSFDGTTSDMGAYGGSESDTIPYRVLNVSSAATSTASISVDWSPNNSYLITNTTNPGSYTVYYNFNAAVTSSGSATVNVSSPTTSAIISGLTSTVSAPPVPAITQTSPRDGKLEISWTASSGATGYKIHYGIVSVSENTIDAGYTTGYVLSGLTNGRTYIIAVSAYAQPTYSIAVTAVDSTGQPAEPGVKHESVYSSPEVSVAVGSMEESANSAEVSDFPERLSPYPDLPDTGCFIATAAYGYYSEPHVQALRAFRDRFLLTSDAGRAFVRWYYRFGPIGAEFLNAHPWLKPAVRIALLPAIGAALFMTNTTLASKLPAAFCFMLTGLYVYLRKKQSPCGGVR